MLGPSVLPGAAAGVPLSSELGAHPYAARGILVGFLVAGFAVASRHAERVSPLSDEYVRRHHMAISVLAPALPVLVQLASFACAAQLSSPF